MVSDVIHSICRRTAYCHQLCSNCAFRSIYSQLIYRLNSNSIQRQRRWLWRPLVWSISVNALVLAVRLFCEWDHNIHLTETEKKHRHTFTHRHTHPTSIQHPTTRVSCRCRSTACLLIVRWCALEPTQATVNSKYIWYNTNSYKVTSLSSRLRYFCVWVCFHETQAQENTPYIQTKQSREWIGRYIVPVPWERIKKCSAHTAQRLLFKRQRLLFYTLSHIQRLCMVIVCE